jgi:hypothetical protein
LGDSDRDPVLAQRRAELASFNDRQLLALLELTVNELELREMIDVETVSLPAPVRVAQTSANLRHVEP